MHLLLILLYYRDPYEVHAIIRMCSEIIRLFSVVCSVDPSIVGYFVRQRMMLSSIFQFLSYNAEKEDALSKLIFLIFLRIALLKLDLMILANDTYSK